MPIQPPPPPPPPTVVLIHGLGRSPRAMRPLERAARARGYRVLNVGYAWRAGDVATHAATVAARIAADAPEGPLLVVTHSLGGILLRHAVATGALPATRVARAVMLAPPNQGSEVADAFWHRRGLRIAGVLGVAPSGAELGTAPTSLVRQLPPVPFALGVVAGTRSLNPVFSAMLPGPDDGKVAVASTRVAGMHDFVAVPHTHTFIMRAPGVIAQTFAFLERGEFAR